jgi:hypothetical protein
LISPLVEGKMIAGVNRRGLSDRRIVMGAFIAISGVSGCTRTDVVRSLEEFALSTGGLMEQACSQKEPCDHLLVSGEDGNPVSVLYPKHFLGWIEASSYLSVSLDTPVFSFHIHDGELWMYVLFNKGEVVDRFNPIPDYWTWGISPEERSEWKGDADVVARTWCGIDAASIKHYLVTWDQYFEDPGKAYNDDEYHFRDCWQLTDFMRTLGMSYPIDQQGQSHGETYTFDVIMEE